MQYLYSHHKDSLGSYLHSEGKVTLLVSSKEHPGPISISIRCLTSKCIVTLFLTSSMFLTILTDLTLFIQ